MTALTSAPKNGPVGSASVMSWKKALTVALVVLLVLIGIPMLMPGMSLAGQDCDPAVAGSPCGVTLLVSAALLVATAWFALHRQRDLVLGLLPIQRLDRPPRLA